MTAERVIHAAIFVLLLVGFWSTSLWACLTFLKDQLVPQIAGVTLSWGIVLLVLYVSFKKLEWGWWG